MKKLYMGSVLLLIATLLFCTHLIIAAIMRGSYGDYLAVFGPFWSSYLGVGWWFTAMYLLIAVGGFSLVMNAFKENQ